MRIGGQEFTWGKRTYIMAELNVTPDSFSGDGVGDDLDAAVVQAVVILTIMMGINIFGKESGAFRNFSLWVMGILTVVTVWSGVDYVLGNLKVVRPGR